MRTPHSLIAGLVLSAVGAVPAPAQPGKTEPEQPKPIDTPAPRPRPSPSAPSGPALISGPPPLASIPNEKLPTIQEVLDKYITALGGEESMRKHKSRTEKGTMTMTGMNGKLVIYSAAPNKRVGVFITPDGELRQGYNGEQGWDTGLGGDRLLEGDALAERARTSDYFQALNLSKNFDIRMVGAEKVDDRKSYRLGLTAKPIGNAPPAPGEQYLIFDAETGLLVGRIAERLTANGRLYVQTRIGDYKNFDGVMVGTKVSTIYARGQQLMTIESVEFDTVPDTTFEVPADLTKPKSPPDATDPAPKTEPKK